MELKICCDASVKLEKMFNVNEISCEVENYELVGDTLNGDIKIMGEYIKDNLEESFQFNEIVPFTLVFKDKNYKIEKITIHDFTYQEIINDGIECNFNIIVEYLQNKFKEEEALEEEKKEETEKELIDTLTPADIIEIKEHESEEDDEDNELIKEGINQKYDKLLEEVLSNRNDNFFEKKQKVMVRSCEKKEESNNIISSIKTNYTSYRVYYPNKESEIEMVCKKEGISIDKVYKDNQKTDFLNKKRIIIK